MKIEYFGHSCFLLTSEDGTRLVVDPYTGIGYEMAQVTADFVVCSHGHYDHTYTEGVTGARAVISEVGEYKLGGIEAIGHSCFHDDKRGTIRGKNTAFVFKADGVSVCHMGDIGEHCSVSFVQNLGKVDVLLIPVGGNYTVDVAGALEYMDAILPKITIPMHYALEGGKIDIAPLHDFINQAEDRGYKITKGTALDTRLLPNECAKEILILEKNDGKRT